MLVASCVTLYLHVSHGINSSCADIKIYEDCALLQLPASISDCMEALCLLAWQPLEKMIQSSLCWPLMHQQQHSNVCCCTTLCCGCLGMCNSNAVMVWGQNWL